MNKTCAILGCGWLGFPLAKKLVQNAYTVHGSTTSTEKLNDLEAETITPFQINLTEKAVEGKIEAFLENVHFLIIDIPPGLRSQPNSDFVQKIKNVLPSFQRALKNFWRSKMLAHGLSQMWTICSQDVGLMD